ncbi:MAG: aminotransferase class IV [Gammaproteobacteria bacterium]|nr:aminotransferase class IV [Gammaproteobacteria bacterium]
MTAVFETMRVRGGTIPLLERHLARFHANWHLANLEPPPSDIVRRVSEKLSERSDDHALRMEWDGSDLVFAARDLPDLNPITLVTSQVRHEGYTVKTTDREQFDRARAEARDAGADEALMLTGDGFVAEGSLFAICWIAEGELYVASLDLGILPSIGRARVIEIAKGEGEGGGIAVHEGRYRREELDGRAVFITTSVRGVVPVKSLDGVTVPEDDIIQGLGELFWPVVDPLEGHH